MYVNIIVPYHYYTVRSSQIPSLRRTTTVPPSSFQTMISGGACGMGVGVFHSLHSTLHVVLKRHLSFLNPGRVLAQCTVANIGRHELVNSPPLRDTVQSASDLSNALQYQYLSLEEAGGIQVRTRELSVGRELPGPARRHVSGIADSGGASKESIRVEGEQLANSNGIEHEESIDDNLLPEDGDANSGFKLDLVQGLKDFSRQAGLLKEEVASLDYRVSPTPFTPVEGAEAIKFAVISVGLLFAFWIGNYYVPDLIFKNTVFKKKDKDPLDFTDATSGDDYPAKSNQDAPEGLSQDGQIRNGDAQGFTVKSGVGFIGRKNKKRSGSGKK